METWLIILIIYTCISLLYFYLQYRNIITVNYKNIEKGVYLKDLPWKERVEYFLDAVEVFVVDSLVVIVLFPAGFILIVAFGIYLIFTKTRLGQWVEDKKDKWERRRELKEEEEEERERLEYIKNNPNKFRDMEDVEVDWSLASRISFSMDLSFTPDHNQIIYIEDEYNAEFNDFFRENEEEIRVYFKEFDKDFIYLPTLLNRLQDGNQIPFANPSGMSLRKEATALRSDMLNQYITKMPECEFGPCLIRFMERGINIEERTYTATYRRLLPSAERSLERQIHDYFSYTRGAALFMTQPDGDSPADDKYDSEWAILMKEIRERVEKLRLHGIEEAVISSLFKKEETLSRMVITKDFRIFLTDYDNMEIKMKSLPKAVYLLFLNHPEGIRFKDLPDYRKELMQIYNKLTNRSNNNAVLKSIEDLTDPTKNSINEKCARIRGAFLEHFGDPLVRNYCITGLRGEPKKIVLPRELVTFE